MMKRHYLYGIGIMLLASTLLVQCKKSKEENTPDTSFDKKGMLENTGANIILPAYASLKVSVDSLQYFNAAFVANPTADNLTELQRLFVQAYAHYQWVSVFEFGPADAELIRANFNTFPCDTVQIKNKIATGDFNLSTVADLDAKGFPAADFLLYGSNHDNNEVIAAFSTGADASNRKTYLTTIINELKAKTNNVLNAWNGSYLSTFVNSTGSSVGSSLGLLVNQLNYDLEILKNYSIGIPAGKKSLGVPLPEKAEAYYARISVQLALEHIHAIENIYLGRSKQGSDGPGLDDYLTHLNAQYNGGSLSAAIRSQLSTAISKLQNVPDPLSATIINSPAVVDAAYLELQKLVVLFKTDMPSALGVLITYQDNDGD